MDEWRLNETRIFFQDNWAELSLSSVSLFSSANVVRVHNVRGGGDGWSCWIKIEIEYVDIQLA